MKTIVLTGGGTSGHVTPNIALLPALKGKGYKIHYIGSRDGIEKQLIEKEGIPYHSINTGKLRRYFDFKNFSDIFRVLDGLRGALSLLRRIKPDLIFSKGGYVACPVVWAAWLSRIPVVIHESDMTPGLTNKLSMPFSQKVCYTFPESASYITKEKGILTGIPIRDSLLHGDASKGRRICGFGDDKPILLIIGGSQGAGTINNIVRSVLNNLLGKYYICHICGKGNLNKEYDQSNGYRQFEYVNEELPHLYAAAEIMVSRAGATSIFEILALQKPALLIPLSKASSRGDQILNAGFFEKQCYSMVIQEEELENGRFLRALDELYRNRTNFINAMKMSNLSNGKEKIMKVLGEFIN